MIKLNDISQLFKNTLTGELHIAKSKIVAWLYLYDKAKNTDRNMPMMDDIVEIEQNQEKELL
jgi:hypothetical protein